jgi:hypothetical protein
VRNFTRALRRTNRRLNALEIIVLPDLEREIRELSSALEEDERDEAFRRKRWFRAQKTAGLIHVLHDEREEMREGSSVRSSESERRNP